MTGIFHSIRQLKEVNSFSKHEQLVQGIINAIDEQLIARGDKLPSVNTMIQELGFARETIVRGFKELISRGIVESENRRGYFVAHAGTDQQVKVALVLYAFDAFQENFYRNFRDGLGRHAQLDVFFHHNNIDIFESILMNIKGKYGMHVIAPILHERSERLLSTLPMNKFLMIDRLLPLKKDFSFLVQEFEESTYRTFAELAQTIGEYTEFVFFFRPDTAEPVEILRAFKKFVKDYKIRGKVLREYQPGSVEAGKIYFTIHNPELYSIVKDTITKDLKLGGQVGLLSHNDDIVKEIMCGGITTFSTDFGLMGQRAARFVLDRKPVREVMPSVLIRRKSL